MNTYDKFKFDRHITNVCCYANHKLRVLSRLAKLLTFLKNESFLKHFLILPFSIVILLGCFVTQ